MRRTHFVGDSLAAGAMQTAIPQSPAQPIKVEGACPNTGVASPHLNVLHV